MSCIGVEISKVSRGIDIAAALACIPISVVAHLHEGLCISVSHEVADARCSLGLASEPIIINVSRVCSLEVTDDGYQVFMLANGGKFLLKDGKTYRVIKVYE